MPVIRRTSESKSPRRLALFLPLCLILPFMTVSCVFPTICVDSWAGYDVIVLLEDGDGTPLAGATVELDLLTADGATAVSGTMAPADGYEGWYIRDFITDSAGDCYSFPDKPEYSTIEPPIVVEAVLTITIGDIVSTQTVNIADDMVDGVGESHWYAIDLGELTVTDFATDSST